MSQVRLQFGWNGVVYTGIKRLPRLDTALRPSKIVLDDKLVEQSELITVSNVPQPPGRDSLERRVFRATAPAPILGDLSRRDHGPGSSNLAVRD